MCKTPAGGDKTPSPVSGSVMGHSKSGFSLLEAVVTLLIISLLLALLLPALQSSREAARLVGCRNNARQLALAVMNYHSNYSQFPASYRVTPELGVITWTVSLLPHMDQSALYGYHNSNYPPWTSINTLPVQEATEPIESAAEEQDAAGEQQTRRSNPYEQLSDFDNVKVSTTRISSLLCMSETNKAQINYECELPAGALRRGGPQRSVRWLTSPCDWSPVAGIALPLAESLSGNTSLAARIGALEPGHPDGEGSEFNSVVDGTSYTILFTERTGGPERLTRTPESTTREMVPSNGGGFVDPLAGEHWLGMVDAQGRPATTSTLPSRYSPGSSSRRPGWVNNTNRRGYGLYGSHTVGVPAAFCDGSVRMLGNDLDSAVLAAVITRAGNELNPRDTGFGPQ